MACYDNQMTVTAALDWSGIDTVLLDMDGTLLDLRFDNWFWREHLPARYAALHAIGLDAARATLAPRFAAVQGTIDWYCIDHWSRELGLDIAAIKRAAASQVNYLPGAEQFLARLRSMGKRSVLVTNAHPETLAIKNAKVGIDAHFDASYSAHYFGLPKEDPAFWAQLWEREPFVAARTLFVDDNLRVLESARRYGIAWLRAVRCPDSGAGPQHTDDFPAIDRVADLLAPQAPHPGS